MLERGETTQRLIIQKSDAQRSNPHLPAQSLAKGPHHAVLGGRLLMPH